MDDAGETVSARCRQGLTGQALLSTASFPFDLIQRAFKERVEVGGHQRQSVVQVARQSQQYAVIDENRIVLDQQARNGLVHLTLIR
jgi:hypothetical protein